MINKSFKSFLFASPKNCEAQKAFAGNESENNAKHYSKQDYKMIKDKTSSASDL